MMRGWIALLVFSLVGASLADPLNVFIIPHSHCDPGWLNTFEGYFRDQVNRILTGVTDALLVDSSKKFVWAEISFFHLWYDQQDQDTRDAVKKIVKNGQLEFVAGGWVQNDEANANFDIVIDQVTEGHDYLHRTFGVVPRVAWQIDPFGHSSLTPSLFARMGFEALVINRIHYGLKASFKEQKSMEFLWTGSNTLGNASEIFTHVLHTHYSAPQGYDWEEGSPHVSPGNVASRANDLVHNLKGRANAYKTNNLLVPFGDDFKFQNPGVQFSNMDQLIKEINGRKEMGVKIQYGTVSDYFDSVVASSKKNEIQFPAYNGDFFPYADNDDSYWTGYYTSRPGLKGHSRGTDSIIRAAEGMYALGRAVANNKEDLLASVDWINHFDGLRKARRNAALVQHHDGITGTAKSFVAADYSARLDQARQASSKTITDMAEILLTDKETPSLTYELKAFEFEKGDEEYAIVVHNPLGWVRRKYIKLTVTSADVTVTSNEGVILSSQIMPLVDLSTFEPTESRFELYFLVEVPPLGLQTYFLSKSTGKNTAPHTSEHFVYSKNFADSRGAKTLSESSKIEIENEHVKVTFQGETGLIKSVLNKDVDVEVQLNQELVDYRTSRSGAYIMRPDSQAPIYTERSAIKLVHITGSLVSQVCTYFYATSSDPNIETSACVKVFSTRGISSTPNVLEVGGYMEVVYSIIGRRNCETVARFSTDLTTKRSFFTDNGLEIRERKGEGTRTENHYYPNLSFSYLQDAEKDIQFSIVSRQAMGTHSRDEGMLEQMLHRALAQDDGRGLGEPNNDQSRIEVVVYLLVQPLEPSVRMGRRLALALQHQPRIMHTETKGGAKAWGTKHKLSYFPFTSQLPHNVHLLSFKARDSITDDVILRLLHIYEAGQHNTFSQPKSLAWDSILADFNFDSKRERSLAMSMDVDVAQARRPRHTSSGKLNHASGIAPKFIKQESQNTQEEGVFISQAALDDKKKEGESKNIAPPGAPPIPPVGRKLHELLRGAHDDVSLRNDAVIFLEPMEIKSFFVQLVNKRTKQQTTTTPGKTTKAPEKNTNTGNKKTTLPPKSGNKITTASAVSQSSSEGEIIAPPITPPPIQVSDNEMRAFLIISVLGTGLVILAYVRLRARRNSSKQFGKRKGLIEV